MARNRDAEERVDSKGLSLVSLQSLFVLFALAFSGCATVSSLPQTGGVPLNRVDTQSDYTNTRIYPYPYPRVFEAAKVVLQAWNFTIKEANPKAHAILASGQTQAFSSGAVLGLYFTELPTGQTRVETIEKRKVATQISIKWHSSIILDGIEKQLALQDRTATSDSTSGD